MKEERIFTRDEGRWYAEPNPPEGYVVVGTSRTAGGGHRWYTYAKIGSFSSLAEFMEEFKKQGRTFPVVYYRIDPERNIIYVLPHEVGGMIGKQGRWVKAISAVLGKKVYVQEETKYLIFKRPPQNICWYCKDITVSDGPIDVVVDFQKAYIEKYIRHCFVHGRDSTNHCGNLALVDKEFLEKEKEIIEKRKSEMLDQAWNRYISYIFSNQERFPVVMRQYLAGFEQFIEQVNDNELRFNTRIWDPETYKQIAEIFKKAFRERIIERETSWPYKIVAVNSK